MRASRAKYTRLRLRVASLKPIHDSARTVPARSHRPGERAMSPELIAIITAAVAIIGLLWNLHRDVDDLRGRMARLEGLFEGFTRRESAPSPPA